jgi:hypothetical protein
MEATLAPLRVYRPSPPPGPPASVVVRYEQAGRPADEAPAPLAYQLAPGDHVLVFASSFETGFPLEMAAGSPKALAAQVTALREHLARMDASQAALHGATPEVKARQTALYGRVLADLGGPRLP